MELLVQLVVNGLIAGGNYALLAIGYTMVYGILKFINFAHGDVAMVGAYLAFLGAGLGLPLLATVPLSMALTALLGMGIERVAYRPLRDAPRLAPLITAIAVSLALESGVMMAWGADVKSYRMRVTEGWQIGPAIITPVQLAIIATALVCMGALHLLLKRTRLGKAIRATADNPLGASVVGIDNDRIISAVFAIGSALAAVASILIGLESNLHPTMGLVTGIKAFAAVVLGGIGNIYGAILGGFLIGMAENLGVWYIPAVWKDSIAYGILVLALLFRPSGLLGEPEETEVKL